MTITRLASAVGMTVRNVRAYSTRGILPPPILHGRTGYYGPEHLARLTLARDLQRQGFTLIAAQRFLSQIPAGTASQTLALHRMLFTAHGPETPERITVAELAKRAGQPVNATAIKLLVDAGVVEQLAAEQLMVRSPALLQIAIQAMKAGIPIQAIADINAVVTVAARNVATAFVDLFREHVWRVYVEAGMPLEETSKVRRSADVLLPLAAETVMATFNRVMGEAIADGVRDEVDAIAPGELDETG